ncbi:hypothetical protein V6N13_074506 [Hibiscus sabdariffa]
MFFVEDLILHAKTTLDQACLIDEILSDFDTYSGHRINKLKSQVFFSSNMSDDDALEICRHLGIQRANDLGTYLSILVMHKRVMCDFYNFILDKVQD